MFESTERDKLIKNLSADGYSKDYLLAQEREGWDAFNNGQGSGELSDIACTFYEHAAKSAALSGVAS